MDGMIGFLLVQAVRKDNTATIEALDQSENRIYLGKMTNIGFILQLLTCMEKIHF